MADQESVYDTMLTVRVTPAMHARLVARAKRRGVSTSTQVRAMLSYALQVAEVTEKKGAPSGQ